MHLPQPAADQITLAGVLAALGDNTRLAIVGDLARSGENCVTCGKFAAITSKSNLSYHIAKLREAGVVQVEPRGTQRLVSLRRDDLDNRFPGLLDSIIATAESMPSVRHGTQDRSTETPAAE